MGNFETAETDTVMASIFKKKEAPKEKAQKLLESMSDEQIEAFLKSISK
jgi:hypothetical protein